MRLFTTVLRRRSPLAAGIASILCVAAPSAGLAATSWPVTSCANDGAGSLRAVIAAGTTLSGDTVDLTQLSCPNGKIALATSSITIAQNSLTLLGPGRDTLRVDAAALTANGRAFNHTGAGTLDVRDLRISGGQMYLTAAGQIALGGCLYSKANISLTSVQIDDCQAGSLQDRAAGGAVYAKNAVTIDQSVIIGNAAYSGAAAPSGANGGAVAANGAVTITESIVSGNTVSTAIGFAHGGGIWAGGAAELKSVEVIGNAAASTQGSCAGGGIFASGNLKFDYGLMAGNTVTLAQTGGGCGSGGAFVNGNFSAKYSTIDSNQALGPAVQTSAGGLAVRGDLTLEGSTVSNNSAAGSGGALYTFDNGAFDRKLFLRNSTISGNHAKWSGGVVNEHKTVQIYNSTIAFNTADTDLINTTTVSPGLQISPFFQDVTVKLQSTIVSNNTSGAGVENDFGVFPTASAVQVTMTNTLLRASSVPTLPTNPACPLLGPLRDNGGFTRTHAVLSGSLAIDHGDNVLINPNTSSPYGFDQRGSKLLNGSFDYLRVSGPAADIGAHEVQQDDVVFDAGFEGCPAVP